MTTVENMTPEDTEFGFKRPEMYSTNIANSITSYGRHVFVLYKTPEAWISHVDEEGLPQRFATLLKDRKSDLLVQTKLNVCEGGGSDGDVLIFPDMNLQCGENVMIEGQTYTISAVTHRYQLRKGKYEPSERRLDVLSAARYVLNLYFDNLLQNS
ncbi:hypothetical protein F2Q68_00026952 [Brassica cretica]|uniref:Uncharacterized protein n=1 Tax=Brassica cretica TaxID=69181 RepID=A0A8S9IBI4_BRACR|nr:hypothetical protein F2Q68_00026952 [Brassica cretica]